MLGPRAQFPGGYQPRVLIAHGLKETRGAHLEDQGGLLLRRLRHRSVGQHDAAPKAAHQPGARQRRAQAARSDQPVISRRPEWQITLHVLVGRVDPDHAHHFPGVKRAE